MSETAPSPTAGTLEGESAPGSDRPRLGLGSTEPPDMVRGSELVLAPGMVFTIEPLAVGGHGIYQAETVVAVTADGCEVPTHAPTDITSTPRS